MSEAFEFGARAALVGVGATATLDIWNLVLNRAFGVPAPDYAMVGRWIGYFPRGKFKHDSIFKAAPVQGEALIGWSAHYIIGMGYAAALIAICGLDWARAPTLLPALVFGVVTVAAPFLIMQPGMGAGIAASKTPKPNEARIKSLAAHTIFGLGLYLTASLTARLVLA